MTMDIGARAREVIDVVAAGGVAIIPLDVAYGIVGNSRTAIETIFAAKRRSFEKPSGMFSNWDLFNEIHVVGDRDRDIVRALIHDNDLPFSVVAPFRRDHPMFRNIDPFVLENTTKNDTLDMLLNAGPLHNEMTRLSHEILTPVVGSSANLSLTGSKFRLEDIEAPVRDAADIEIDGGQSKYHNPDGLSSTIVDLRSYKTVRRGVCYDRICDILLRDFALDLKTIGPA